MIYYNAPMRRPDPFEMLREMARAADFRRQATFPAVNLWQGSEAVALTAELPGFRPEDIDITVQDTTLTISGERAPVSVADDAVWQRRERLYGKFVRSIGLPFRVDPDKVEARFVNGVLQIVLHRPEEDKPRRIAVKAA
ncbi:Hsp20/alpha crystallin family protein [Albidovulum sp.]